MIKNPLNSFKYAFRGLRVLWGQNNFRIHVLTSLLVLLFSFLLKISQTDFIILLLCISMVLVTEALNTAIEKICDFIQPNIDPKIAFIKDVSAAAVLISAIVSAIIGVMIFWKYLVG